MRADDPLGTAISCAEPYGVVQVRILAAHWRHLGVSLLLTGVLSGWPGHVGVPGPHTFSREKVMNYHDQEDRRTHEFCFEREGARWFDNGEPCTRPEFHVGDAV